MSIIESADSNDHPKKDIVIFRDALINIMSLFFKNVSRGIIRKKIRQYVDENISTIPFEDITDLLISKQEKDFHLINNISYYNKDIQQIIWNMIKEHYADNKIFDSEENEYVDARVWFFKKSSLFRGKISPQIIEEIIVLDFSLLFSLKAENNFSMLLDEIPLIQKLFGHFVNLKFMLKHKAIINQQPKNLKKDFVSFLVKSAHAGSSVNGSENKLVALEMLLSIENWHLINKKALPEVLKFASKSYHSQTVNKKIESLIFRYFTENVFIHMNSLNLKMEELCLSYKYLPSKRLIKNCETYQGTLRDKKSWNDLFELTAFMKKNQPMSDNKVATVFGYMKDMSRDFFLNVIQTDIFRLMFKDKKSYNADKEFLEALKIHYFISKERVLLKQVTPAESSAEPAERL